MSCRGEKLKKVEGYLLELEKLLEGVSENLRETELQLRAPTPVGPEADGATGCFVSIKDTQIIVLCSYYLLLTKHCSPLILLWSICLIQNKLPASISMTL